MQTPTGATLRRHLPALTITAGLTLGAVGCSQGAPQQDRTVTTHSASRDAAPSAQDERAGTQLPALQGQNGLSLAITSAVRDPAGYLTVRGSLKNDAPHVSVVPAELRGDDLDVARTGPSLAGATLVDFTHKRRYYVLRDTSGHPLTTTGLSTLRAGESAHVFLQFPAPAADTATVGLQLPTFDTANIKISG